MRKILHFAGLMALSLAATAQTIYTENFETGNADKISGDNFRPFVDIKTNACGEAEITDLDATDFMPRTFAPMVVTFRTASGSETTVDISANKKMTIGLRAAMGTQIRAAYVSPGSSPTPRLRDEVRQTVQTNYELEELVFDFTTLDERGDWDETQAQRMFLEIDPSVPEFTGGLIYIDYIVVGDVDTTLITPTTCSGTDDTQFAFGDGSTYSILDFSTEGQPGIGGERIDQVILDQIAICGLTKIKDNPDNLLGETEPLFVSARNEIGDVTEVDMTGNTKVVIRAQAFGGDATIRVDLKASEATGDNSTNGGSARITKTFPAGEWVEQEYLFFPGQLKDIDGNDVSVTEIKGFNMSFDQELGGIGADSIIFDYITFGDAVGVENTQCVNSVSSKKEVSTLKYFPNPVTDVLRLESPVNGTLTIMSQLGEVIKTETVSTNTSVVSTSSLESGMYIIQVSTVDGKVFTNTFSKD